MNSKQYADMIVRAHARFSPLDGFFNLHVDDVPDYELAKFTSILMSENEDMAWEATGPDNPLYEGSMLPKLQHFLSNMFDIDSREDFLKSWQEGMTHYFKKRMSALLESSLENYNIDFKDHDNYEEEASSWV